MTFPTLSYFFVSCFPLLRACGLLTSSPIITSLFKTASVIRIIASSIIIVVKGKSTTFLLLHTTHDWFTLLDQQLEVMCVYFDFKKAFFTLFHIEN